MHSLVPWRPHPASPGNSLDVASFAKSVLQSRRTETQQLLITGLDNSASVFASGAHVHLNAALPSFLADLQRDAAVRASVLGSFAVFTNDDRWRVTAPFAPVMELVAPSLKPTSSTPLCTRIIEEIRLVKARRALLQSALHVDQRKSWVIEMTDGFPTDSGRAGEARKAIQEEAVEAGIEVYLFGLGEGADMRFLQSLAQPGRPAEALDSDRDFASLFNWVSKSLRITSRSIAGAVNEIESLSGRMIRTE